MPAVFELFALSRQTIRHHSSQLSADSRLGEGSTADICVPHDKLGRLQVGHETKYPQPVSGKSRAERRLLVSPQVTRVPGCAKV